MTRVCGVFGTWQLFTLVAALRQANVERGDPEVSHDDTLLVYETAGVSEEFKATLDRLARAAWPWKRIVWAYDLLTKHARLSKREYHGKIEAVRAKAEVPFGEVDEVWACLLTRPPERLLFEAFPRARIALYEDGLVSYLPLRAPEPSHGASPSLRKRLRRLLVALGRSPSPYERFRYTGETLDARHLARVGASYLQLSESEPMPEALASVPRVPVDYGRLRSVLGAVGSALGDELGVALPRRDERAPDRLLVLGQALARNGIVSREVELGLYRSVVERAIARGYRVLWKEHPRVDEAFFPELQAYAETLGQGSRVQRLRLPHAYPIELVAARLGIVGCAVGTSAAPFYLKRLYGIACYTFAEDALPHLQGPDVFMNRMVRREALPLSELPAISTGHDLAVRAAFQEETA